jgi:hypothetical protein
MALYWHPFLAQFLREDYGDRLVVQEEVNLGDMPLRVDLLLIRRNPRVRLPYPFDHLGERTLVSYCGPDDRTEQKDLAQLEVYGILYQLREKIRKRNDVTLWLVASRFARNVSQRDGAYLARARQIGPGVKRGSLCGFPTFVIDQNMLPVNDATMPLVLTAKGRVERITGEYLIDHRESLRRRLLSFAELHADMLEEMLTMKRLTLEQIGITDKEARILVRLLGEEKVARLLGEKRFISIFGEERILELLGEERILELLGEERLRRWLEEKQKKEQNGKTTRKRRSK